MKSYEIDRTVLCTHHIAATNNNTLGLTLKRKSTAFLLFVETSTHSSVQFGTGHKYAPVISIILRAKIQRSYTYTYNEHAKLIK